MKKFRFTLQPVLEHRERLEDEKQQAVAQRKRALDDAERELRRLNDKFRTHSERLRSEHRTLDGEQLRVEYAHVQFLDRAIVAQIRVVAERRVALDRARDELLEASKDRIMVEKLKDHRKALHDAEAQQAAQSEMDDQNARRFGRKLIGGTS
jgi:flagellar FliJ protein